MRTKSSRTALSGLFRETFHEGVDEIVMRDALQGDRCGEDSVPLTSATVRDDATPLLDVLFELNRAPFFFVTPLGKVGGIVTRSDLEKPAVRMWLFGVTLRMIRLPGAS